MRQITLGTECFEDGDYLAWKDMNWTLYGQAVMETINAEEPCLGDQDMVIIDGSMDQPTCMQLCENLGGRAPSIITAEEWLTVKNFVGRYIGFVVWVAISDEGKEDQWLDFYSGQVMNHSVAWLPWAPNMGENENYALLTKSADGLVGLDDAYPDYDGDCLCENHPGKYLKLRGLCNSSAIDTYYQLKNDLTDFRQLRFVGLHTFLEYDSGLDLWNLSVADEKVSGFSRISTASFLALGRHNWTIRGDRGCKEDINTFSFLHPAFSFNQLSYF